MAKLTTEGWVGTMSGKECQHSKFYARTNKRTHTVTTGKRCNPSEKEPTADQLTARSRFAKLRAAAISRLADEQEKAKLLKGYNAQTKYGSLLGYTMHKLSPLYDEDGQLIQG